MKIKKRSFGTLSSGQKVSLFTVSNGKMSFSVTNFGCIITSILVPSVDGRIDDVVLGYSTLDGYIRNGPLFGALVGRYAGRIANAAFSIDGTAFRLIPNFRGHCIHGAWPQYHKQVWKAVPFKNGREAGVEFSRVSPAGEQGFPGNLELKVTYSLTSGNDILIRYSARTDAPTPVNLTNHTYFNLGGTAVRNVLDQRLQLFAERRLALDENGIPTGELLAVAGTPFDFTVPKPIGADIAQIPGGYDHTWEISGAPGELRPVAGAYDPVSGRALTVHSTLPGVQLYCPESFDERGGKLGMWYGPNSGFCLETQFYPDSPNRAEFPGTVLRPGERFRHETVWHFDFEA